MQFRTFPNKNIFKNASESNSFECLNNHKKYYFFMVNKFHILTHIHIFMTRCIFINLKSYNYSIELFYWIVYDFFSRNDRFFSTFAFGIFVVNSNFCKFQKCCHLFKEVLKPAGQQTRNFLTHLKCKVINL